MEADAAICVQDIDVQCVLQFTLIHAAGCVLHRRTSRVIHRLKLFFRFCVFFSPARLPPSRGVLAEPWPTENMVSMKMIRSSNEKKDTSGAAATVRTAELFKPSPQPPARSPRHPPNTHPRGLGGGGEYRRRAGWKELPLPKRRRPRLVSSETTNNPEPDALAGQVPPKSHSVAGRRAGRVEQAGQNVRPSVPLFEFFALLCYQRTVMILPQVHLRKPCYDFYFL